MWACFFHGISIITLYKTAAVFTNFYHFLNMKGMERIKTVPLIIQIAAPKNAVLNCTTHLH
jgi:hypothetical protein